MKKHALSLLLVVGLATPILAQTVTRPGADGPVTTNQNGDQLRAPQPAGTPQPVPTPTPGENAPQLVFETTSHDFGTVLDTDHPEFEFKFTNKGNGTLVLQQPTASCGCTTPQLTKMEYAPGESGVIKVGYKGAGKRGPQAQNVTVKSNDPLAQNLRLDIKVEVEPIVSVEPTIVNFDEIMQGQTAKQTVTITGRSEDFAATYASVGKFGKYIKANVVGTETIDVGGKKRRKSTIEFTLEPGAPKGHINSASTIRTSDANSPLTSVQILGEIVGDLKPVPMAINAGVIQPGESFQRTFRVTSRSGKPFNIIGNEQSTGLAEPMKLDIKPVEGSAGYEITVTGRAAEQASPLTGNLMLKTDVKGEETITIPLRGNVRPRPSAPPSPAAPSLDGPVGPALPEPAPQPVPAGDPNTPR